MSYSFLDPIEILDRLNLKPDMLAADFGSGHGIFTFLLAEKLKDGLVYAIDVQKSALSVLNSSIVSNKTNNIQIIHSNLEAKNGSQLQDSFLDLVLLINVLFQTENKDAIINEAKRALKKEGNLLVLENEKLIIPREFKKMAEEIGFSVKKHFKIGDYFGMVFEKI